MNILFYGTKKYDEEFFDAILPEYPELSIHYLEANLSPETAALAAGYEAICAFVNANIGAETVEQLHRQGVKLILMRCAGYNNVDLKKTAEYGINPLTDVADASQTVARGEIRSDPQGIL